MTIQNEDRPATLLGAAMRPLNCPRHVALGVAFGCLVGIVPNFSVVPWALGLIALLLPLNLVAFVVTAIAAAYLAPNFDPQFHALGYSLLTETWTQAFWEFMTQWRYFEWLQLHNTVVAGSFATGVIGLLPVFVVAWIGGRLCAPLVGQVRQHLFARWSTQSPELVH